MSRKHIKTTANFTLVLKKFIVKLIVFMLNKLYYVFHLKQVFFILYSHYSLTSDL